MDFYPFNLLLAVVTATASIFLGFLPSRNLRTQFFAWESGKGALAWVIVAVTSPPEIRQWQFILAFVCCFAWRQLWRDRAFSGKIWLSIASGLGISVGVVYILVVTPRALPPGLPALEKVQLLASIYIGGAVVGLAYVAGRIALAHRRSGEIDRAVAQRYFRLLVGLALVRAALLVTSTLHPPTGRLNLLQVLSVPAAQWHEAGIATNVIARVLLALGCVVVPLAAWVAAAAHARRAEGRMLSALVIAGGAGFAGEWLARYLIL
jgi:hypothetical protein